MISARSESLILRSSFTNPVMNPLGMLHRRSENVNYTRSSVGPWDKSSTEKAPCSGMTVSDRKGKEYDMRSSPYQPEGTWKRFPITPAQRDIPEQDFHPDDIDRTGEDYGKLNEHR